MSKTVSFLQGCFGVTLNHFNGSQFAGLWITGQNWKCPRKSEKLRIQGGCWHHSHGENICRPKKNLQPLGQRRTGFRLSVGGVDVSFGWEKYSFIRTVNMCHTSGPSNHARKRSLSLSSIFGVSRTNIIDPQMDPAYTAVVQQLSGLSHFLFSCPNPKNVTGLCLYTCSSTNKNMFIDMVIHAQHTTKKRLAKGFKLSKYQISINISKIQAIHQTISNDPKSSFPKSKVHGHYWQLLGASGPARASWNLCSGTDSGPGWHHNVRICWQFWGSFRIHEVGFVTNLVEVGGFLHFYCPSKLSKIGVINKTDYTQCFADGFKPPTRDDRCRNQKTW